jgi:DUF971 family protein
MSFASSPSPLLAPAVPAPHAIEISADCVELRLSWPDLPQSALTGSRLRAACKCAPCTRARIDGDFPPRFDAVTIAEVSIMGNFGLNIGFSDGHRRGIYPWPYLREIAASAAAADAERSGSRAV